MSVACSLGCWGRGSLPLYAINWRQASSSGVVFKKWFKEGNLLQLNLSSRPARAHCKNSAVCGDSMKNVGFESGTAEAFIKTHTKTPK